MMLAYRLDELGWLQFEELCQALLKEALGMGIQAWGGSGDFGRDAYYPDDLPFPIREERNEGPFIFQAKFVSGANGPGANAEPAIKKAVAAEARRIEKRKHEERWNEPRHYVLLTNAPINAELRAKLARTLKTVLTGCEIHFQTGQDLCTGLDARPRLRLSFPQLLGLADLQGLLRGELLADIDNRTQMAMRLAHQEALSFVPTGAYRQALFLLEKDNTVVLSGPPEVGKTTIARLLALGFMADEWEVYECRSPQDLLRARRAEPKQLFIADDAFGSTEYRPDIADEWAGEMEVILAGLDPRHRLIWTSRSAVLRGALAELALKGHAEQWPEPDQIEVNASLLTVEEKALMVYRHCKAANLSDQARTLVRQHARLVVGHKDFTPERIARFVRTRLPALADLPAAQRESELQRAVHEEMGHPTKPMRLAFEALDIDDQRLLIAMLDAGPSSVSLEALAASYHRTGATADLAERLAVLGGHFLRRLDEETVEWMHPSWRDLVIERLATDRVRRRDFLSQCSVDGLVLALSTRGGSTGERHFPLLKESEDWDALIGRVGELVHEVGTADTRRLLSAIAQLSRRRPCALGTRLVCLTLNEIRSRWDERAEALDPYTLDLYYATSERLAPLVPSPDLRATWEAYHPGRDLDAVDEDDLLDQPLADHVSRWLSLISVIELNEPRFLRQVSFPTSDADAMKMYTTLVSNELASEYLVSGIEEHAGFGSDMRELETTLGRAARFFTDRKAELEHLARIAADKAEGFEREVERLQEEAEERRRQIDEWEASDEDESGEAPEKQLFDLASFMSDL